MGINYELLDATMKFIERQPDNHNQGLWFDGELDTNVTTVDSVNVCGTSGCFAGWSAIFGGWHQVRPHKSEFSECKEDCCKIYDAVVDETGHETHMREAGLISLGISYDQAEDLFDGGNTKRQLRAMVDKLHDDPNTYLYDIRNDPELMEDID